MPHDGTKPYHFDAVYPIEQAIDVGKRAASGEVSLALAKDIAGCVGCVAEKHDSDPDPVGAAAPPKGKQADLSKMSVKALGQRLEKKASEAAPMGAAGDGPDAVGAIPVWLLPILLTLGQKVAQELLKRLLAGKSVK